MPYEGTPFGLQATASPQASTRAGRRLLRSEAGLAAELLVEDADPDDRSIALLEVQLAGGSRGIGRPRVGRLAVSELLEQDELVIGRPVAVRLADRVEADERANGDPDELELGVGGQELEHRVPVSAPDAAVEALDVVE